MQDVLYAIVNNRVDTDVLLTVKELGPYFEIVDQDIRAMVDDITESVVTNLDDPLDTDVIKTYATQWLLNQGLVPVPPGQLNQQAAEPYRLDGLQIRNYKGIGANFNPIVGLSAFDLILFRAINGQGKSSVTSAICQDPQNILPVDRFNDCRANQTNVSISLSPQPNNGITPAFRKLGTKQIPLVKPDLNKVLSSNVNPNDLLPTLSGQNRLVNQEKVVSRLLAGQANWPCTLNSMQKSINLLPPPTTVINDYDDWKRNVRNYRRTISPQSLPIKAQLNWDYLIDGLRKLWADVCINMSFAQPQRHDFLAVDEILQTIVNRLGAPPVPDDLSDAAAWLLSISKDLDGIQSGTGKLSDFDTNLSAFGRQSNNVLVDIVNRCNELSTWPNQATLVDGASITDANKTVSSLANRAGFDAVTITDNENIGDCIEPFIQYLNGWLLILETEHEEIDDEITAFDHRQKILRESKEWLENQQVQTVCPTCDTSFVKSQLINIVVGLLQPKHPLQGEADSLKKLIGTCDTTIQELDEKCDAWKRTKQKKDATKNALIALFSNHFPVSGSASDTGIASVNNFITTWTSSAQQQNWSDENLLRDSKTNLDNLRQAIKDVDDRIKKLPKVHPLRGEYERLTTLLWVVKSEAAINVGNWVHNWPDLTLAHNAVIEHFRTTAQNLQTKLNAVITAISIQLVHNAHVQATYANFVATGNHPFLVGHPMNGANHNRLSEGYRVVHAVAAIFALAAAPNAPGNDAGFIILDEPTKGLDSNLRFTLAQCIATNATKQVIVTTYDNDFADSLIAQYGAMNKTTTDYTLQWDNIKGTTHHP